MAGFLTRGTMKPPAGAQVNPEHPLAQGLLCAVLFNAVGSIDTNGKWQVPIVPGTAVADPTHPPPSGVSTSNLSGNVSLSSTTEGSAMFNDGVRTWHLGADALWLPTTACTVTFIRRCTNAAAGNGEIWAASGASGTRYMQTFCPYSDGKVYWYFGGTSAPNLLSTSASVSTSTTRAERYVMHAGPRGSAIWRDGVVLASQTTAVTRTNNVADVFNVGDGAGAPADWNYFALYNTQWSDELCRWWSAEPYAHLYPAAAERRYFLLGDLAGAAAPAALMRRTLTRLGTRIGARQEHP
jgi:hypothetical protein